MTDGAVFLIDFMPPRSGHSNLVRIVVGKRGRANTYMELAVRFGYGATVPWGGFGPPFLLAKPLQPHQPEFVSRRRKVQ